MQTSQPLLIEEFNYPLADEQIAKYPLTERDSSKLLLYKEGEVSEDIFRNIGNHLPSGALLVYNNTRVIQARLPFFKESGARIELFCLEPIAPHDYVLALGATQKCTWRCMVGNLKKWKSGALTLTFTLGGGEHKLYAEKILTEGNTHQIMFSWDDNTLSFAEILNAVGELPIPPYLHRPTEEQDKQSYQTVYSCIEGSVAAPTAGLHFTDSVLESLHRCGIRMQEVTLHVGAGTFQPVKSNDANDHVMHTEFIAVKRQTIAEVKSRLGNIVAVGTTSVRTLESLYYLGCQVSTNREAKELLVRQFEPYTQTYTLTAEASLQALLDYLDYSGQSVLVAATQIMIKPGFTFRIICGMITNFHQPQSTLLLLVSAFVQGNWKKIYHYALSHHFRFLSYGDSSLLLR